VSIRLVDGKWLIVDGQLATDDNCCCAPPCSGACDEENPCPEGCECVDGECVAVALGTCCEQGCVECTGGNYSWDGTKWALTICFPEGCPTTECLVTDCPAVWADEDPPSQEAIDFAAAIGGTVNLFIRWCCPFPDSQYTCFQSTQAQCTEVFRQWTAGEGCGEDPQTYCDGKFNPLP
jgi:hypothetical protein